MSTARFASLLHLRRPRRGVSPTFLSENVRPLLRPVFADLPEQKPVFVCQTVDDLFTAIGAGWADSVIHWLDNRLINFRAIDEAALDLAVQKNHFHIAELFLDEMKHEETIQEAMQKKPLESSDLYNRVRMDCESEHHFNVILFETFFSGKAMITLCYNSPLMKPYLAPLIPFSSNHFDDRMYFNFYLEEESEADIYIRAYRILNCLTEISSVQFDKILRALDEFFVDARMGFPGGNYFARHGEFRSQKRKSATYVEFQMYRAAWELDCNKMFDLLRNGADPNATFDDSSILYHVAMYGTDKVFKPKEIERVNENYKAVLDLVEMLLQYGVNPGVTKHGRTVADSLVYYEQSVVKEELKKQLYRDIIKRLSAANRLASPMPVHPSLGALPMARTIMTANEIMEKRRNKESYIRNVMAYAMPAVNVLHLNMRTGHTVRIESKKLTVLSEAERNEMFEFFKSNFKLPPDISAEAYWKMTLTPNKGKIVVDIVRQRDAIIGLVLTEIMDAELSDKPTIYYSKFTIGRLNEYPGLMKLIMLARNFADKEEKKESYSFYEATSASGFAIGGDIKQFPAHIAAGAVLPQLVKRVYGADETIVEENGVWYLKDPVIAAEDHSDDTEFKNPSVLLRKTFRKVYQKPGYTLLMCSENDAQNRQAFTDSLALLIGIENIKTILNSYADKPDPALYKFSEKL